MSIAATLDFESTLTDRYQTTVPEPVRRALKLNKGDRLHYRIRNGRVLLERASEQTKEDPVMGKFLNFLARDIERHPNRIQPLDTRLVDRLHSLVGDVDVDLDQPLRDEDE